MGHFINNGAAIGKNVSCSSTIHTNANVIQDIQSCEVNRLQFVGGLTNDPETAETIENSLFVPFHHETSIF